MRLSLIEDFPGEIRNVIYELCVDEALLSGKAKQKNKRSTRDPGGFGRQTNIAEESQDKKPEGELRFNVTALPRWEGPPVLRIEGLGPLPLMFVSKKINEQVSSLIYARIGTVSLGGYILQHRSEDARFRWNNACTLLRKQSGLLKFTRNITIKLPSTRADLEDSGWRAMQMGLPYRQEISEAKIKPWGGVIPGLVDFLLSFENLSTVRIIVEIENKDPPSWEPLFPLNMVGKVMPEFDFVAPASPFSLFVRPQPWHWNGVSVTQTHVWWMSWIKYVQDREIVEQAKKSAEQDGKLADLLAALEENNSIIDELLSRRI